MSVLRTLVELTSAAVQISQSDNNCEENDVLAKEHLLTGLGICVTVVIEVSRGYLHQERTNTDRVSRGTPKLSDQDEYNVSF